MAAWPTFSLIRVDRPSAAVHDVRASTRAALEIAGVALKPGGRVAIAVGSRGIHDIVPVVATVAAWVRSRRAEPFLVPAMGSHGGATGPGQRAVLEAYGLTGPSVGCAIEATMDTVPLPQGDSPVPVHTDAIAARADATILVNRVKPHTDFHGPYESGLAKMAAIGLGKQRQADALHAYGVLGLRDLMPIVARQVIEHSNVVLGVAIVEGAHDRTVAVEAIPAAEILAREPDLLDLARVHLARLPVDDLDVLLVDRMGKDISGVGMDTNVIGRLLIAGEPEPAAPSITMISCHALTAASHGNATGMGLADVVTRSFADAVDAAVTRTNVITSGFLARGKHPLVADDDQQAWELCLRGAGVVDAGTVRAARIADTAHVDRLWVSDAVRAELEGRTDIGVEGAGGPLLTPDRRLAPFDGVTGGAIPDRLLR